MSQSPVVLVVPATRSAGFDTAWQALEDRYRIRDLSTDGEDWRRSLHGALEGGPEKAPAVAVVVGLPLPNPGLPELVEEVRRGSQGGSLGVPVLAITEERDPEALTELLDSGVDDFSTRPSDPGDLLARLWRQVRPTPPGQLPQRVREKAALRNLVGESSAFLEVIQRIPLLARCDSTVLLTGETGTGKEGVSRAIHYLSERSGQPFVPVNCGAIPVELVENELFGHDRAAYTGADRARPGLVAEAEGGTLLLDEVDCLPLKAQVKLLRFLQEREYRPLGSPRVRKADLRLIAATNSDVEEAVESGRLRRDLYYRLNVLPLRLPPLRERPEDISLLARHFLAEHARSLDRPCPRLSPEAEDMLRERPWPGNVRELRHLMERAVVMSGGRSVVYPTDMLPPGAGRGSGAGGSGASAARAGPGDGGPLSFREAKQRVVDRFERQYLQDLLRTHRGNITQASKAAKKNRRAFWELLRKHRIDAGSFRDA
jgi:two-component system response regulator GlrR